MVQVQPDLPFRTVGIDLGDLRSWLCRLDEKGEVLEEYWVAMEADALREIFGAWAPCRVVIEASFHSAWVERLLRELKHEVIVANPRHVYLISKGARKTDRNDALLLARLGRVDPELLRPVTHRSEEAASVRAMLRARSGLVATRTKLINILRSEVKVLGGRLPSCSGASFAEKVADSIPKNLQRAFKPVLQMLRQLQKHVERYDAEVEKLCEKKYPQTRVLRQVGGVGALIALTYVITLDDPSRFTSSRSVGCYLGLTPRSYQSGARDPQLRISKHGDGTLRRLLVSAASHIMRERAPDTDLKRYGKKLARGGGTRDRARARVAVARKLAVLLHRLWITGEVYRPTLQAVPQN